MPWNLTGIGVYGKLPVVLGVRHALPHDACEYLDSFGDVACLDRTERQLLKHLARLNL